MKTTFYAIAFGAGLLIAGSWGAYAQEALGVLETERDCATDVQSLCAGVKPGGGRVLACLQSHVAAGEISVGCSTILSKPSGSPGNARGTLGNSARTPRMPTSANA
jgi:hypothetical protein